MADWNKIAATLGFPLVVLPDAASGSAESALRHLVTHLAQDGRLDAGATEEAVGHLMKRERLGSTALGRGIALPHARSPGLTKVAGILAQCPAGVLWDGAQGPLVRIICLILAPWDRPGESMRVLVRVSEALRS